MRFAVALILLLCAACSTPVADYIASDPPAIEEESRELLTEWNVAGARGPVSCIDFDEPDNDDALAIRRQGAQWGDLVLGTWHKLDDVGHCSASYNVDGDTWLVRPWTCGDDLEGYTVEIVESSKPRSMLPPSLYDDEDLPGFEVAFDCPLSG